MHDDPDGYGTWSPGSQPNRVDISTTPNRLLYSMLASQAVVTPSIVTVDASSPGPFSLTFVLSSEPTADVTVR